MRLPDLVSMMMQAMLTCRTFLRGLPASPISTVGIIRQARSQHLMNRRIALIFS